MFCYDYESISPNLVGLAAFAYGNDILVQVVHLTGRNFTRIEARVIFGIVQRDKSGWMDAWMNEWMNERTNERTNEWMNDFGIICLIWDEWKIEFE